MGVIKNLLGFRACNFQHVSLASGRAVFSYCGAGADPSTQQSKKAAVVPCPLLLLLLVSAARGCSGWLIADGCPPQ
jgi:hypothetical protein